jgi:hypothetical protein
MIKLYGQKIFLLLLCFSVSVSTRSQITWSQNSGSAGAGSFTISGNGSITTLNSTANIAFQKHGSGASAYYTCNNCTLNIQITGQLVIDYPVYLTNTRLIVGKAGFGNVLSTSGITVNGSSQNAKQALYLDDASSIELVSPTNFIKLQSSPVGYIYFDYTGAVNGTAPANAKQFAGTNNSPLCGLTSSNSSSYTCSQGQENGPAVLSSSGFNVVAPLPVILVNFSANLNSNKTISLSWSTQMELNLSYFTIERSADASNWEAIGNVQANGNSSSTSYYSFSDQDPLGGSNYYRLQMTDLDNKSGFTEVELVTTPIIKLFKIFPNPSKDYVDITLSKAKNGSVRLINQFGQILQQKQVSANSDGTTLSFQLFGYPPGNYYVQVIGDDGSHETGKLIITR